MNKKVMTKFIKTIKQSIKTELPEFVKFDGYENRNVYLTIPLDKRFDDDFIKVSRAIKRCMKKFDLEEYGSGTGGKVYDFHYGPNNKIIKQQLRDMKKTMISAIKDATCIDDLRDVFALMRDCDMINSNGD